MASSTLSSRRVALQVRDRVANGGERLWRLEDFRDLPFAAVAQALSRMTRAGSVQRLSKGTYYRARPTAFGASKPNPAALRELASRERPVFPSGAAAANALGFTTQNPGRREVATSAASLPRKLVGEDTVVHTRRPNAWTELSESDAALLDFLRHAGRTSELSSEDTVERTLKFLRERGRYQRLASVASTEPPRVRALLGALGEQLGMNRQSLGEIRSSLNPLSRFDFGLFSGLPTARAWQAKEPRQP
ncbi:MAG: hypothetical protein ACKVWV_17735 [Planctomycetota bacterium]